VSNYNAQYRKFIDEREFAKPQLITRGKFYLIKEYTYEDGTKKVYSETTAPIVFVLFVSKIKDIVHAVKVSNVNPTIVKKFFGKLLNEDEEIKLKGTSKMIYEKFVSKVPAITSEAYRTYTLSNIGKLFELTMEVDKITPKHIRQEIEQKKKTENKKDKK